MKRSSIVGRTGPRFTSSFRSTREGCSDEASTTALNDREVFNMNEFRNNERDDVIVCFDCGSSDIVKEMKQQVFQYGSGESAVDLIAKMPVYTCKTCGYQFAGPEADDARHDAVCRHLGVLTPEEIASIRESTGLSRAQFAERTRIGIASLKRWETGVLIQNAANDELIYLMSFPENVERLQLRRHSEPMLAMRKSCRRFGVFAHFPALEREGELEKCMQEATRIQRRGCVLAPVA
jgi:putative zinc finger/helix-turn-helix YgiT family protein